MEEEEVEMIDRIEGVNLKLEKEKVEKLRCLGEGGRRKRRRRSRRRRRRGVGRLLWRE
jgi:hypothetical protein